MIALLLITALDKRFYWSHVSLGAKIAGFVGILIGFCLIFLVMKENPFLARNVEIQKSRNQKVVKKGPYACVRHPMYLGSILLILGIPVALGSFYGLIIAGLLVILIIFRTYLEDKILQNELDGYKAYKKHVKYRLLPGVW
jgi:protein-S-isoprenylcysteine O-methyltransferase Ste14